jgi:membrane associated rhomboid family serine protease
MLLPIGDDNTMRRMTPVVTYTLVAINVLVFIYQLTSPDFTAGYSVVPYEITHGVDLVGMARRGGIPQAPGPHPIYLTILTAMFMHGGFMHILGNMVYLWIFGDNVEDQMGHMRFLIFYLLCGVAATGAHIIFNANSTVPSLGASGAIAGVLAAYLVLFPNQRVRVLIPLGILFPVVELPAIVVIGFWALLQFFSGFGSLGGSSESGGVAYMAHIGGFVAGLVLVWAFRNQSLRYRPTYRREI